MIKYYIFEKRGDMKYKLIIIDLDNTLIDFDRLEEELLDYIFRKYDICSNKEKISIFKDINKKLWSEVEKGTKKRDDVVYLRFKYFLEKYDLKRDYHRMSDEYLDNMHHYIYLFDHVLPTLDYLKKHFKLVMMTNGVKRVQEMKLKKSGLNKYFDEIIISEDTGYNKPQVEIFKYMEGKIGKYPKSEILIVGDSLTSDIKGGKNYGIDTCFFNRKGLPINEDVDYEITDIKELIEIVK